MAPVLKDEYLFPILPWPHGRDTLSSKTSCQESSNKCANLDIKIMNTVLLVTYFSFLKILLSKNTETSKSWPLQKSWWTCPLLQLQVTIYLLSSVCGGLVWKLWFATSILFWSYVFLGIGLEEQDINLLFHPKQRFGIYQNTVQVCSLRNPYSSV